MMEWTAAGFLFRRFGAAVAVVAVCVPASLVAAEEGLIRHGVADDPALWIGNGGWRSPSSALTVLKGLPWQADLAATLPEWGEPSHIHIDAAENPSSDELPEWWLQGRSHPVDDDHDWLRKWLSSLKVQIPTTSTDIGGINFTISDGLCHDFQIDDVYSSATPDPGFDIGVKGLSVLCKLHWEAVHLILPLPSLSGDVLAQVANSSAGGPIKILADTGAPPLPTEIVAYECTSQIQVTHLSFSGSALSGLLELLSGLIKSILNSSLDKVICKNVDQLLHEQGSALLKDLNSAVRSFLETGSATPTHPDPLPQPDSDFVQLSGNPGIRLMDQLINGALGSSSSPFNLTILTSLLLGQHGRFSADVLGMLPLGKALHLSNWGVLNISVTAFVMEGLNSWSELSFSQPTSRELGLGMALDSMKVNLTVKLEVIPDGQGPLHGQTLTETFTFALGISDFRADGSMFLALNSSKLGTYSFNQIPNVGCLAAATHQPLLTKAELNGTRLQTQLIPDTESSLEQHLDQLINLVASTLMDQFAGAISSVSSHAVRVTLRDLANEKLKQETASPSCPESWPIYASFGLSLVSRVTSALSAGAAVLLFVILSIRRRRAKRARTLSTCIVADTTGQATPVPSFQTLVEGDTSPVSSGGNRPFDELLSSPPLGRWDSLAFHPRTPRSLVWVIPCLILANITLVISSNSFPGTDIMIRIKANGEDIASLPAVKQYTLVSSIKDMADSKVYALVILIIVFSGCWPYVKLLTMLYCWFAPTRMLSVKWRQKVLFFVDAYGKWSLVDMFIMVIMMVAFKFDVTDADVPLPLFHDIFSSVGASVQLLVNAEPRYGIHSFVLATLGSLFLGHMVSGCHRYAHQLCEYGVPRDGNDRKSRLCNRARPPGLKGQLSVLGPAVTLSVCCFLVLSGIIVDSFQFTFQGLSGLLLGEEGRVRPFSVASLAVALPQSQPDPSLFGLKWLQFCFVVFTMAFALSYPILLTILWCAPLSEKLQRRLLVTAQVMNAWSSLEVFVVSIGASVLEIEKFALAILGSACDPINHLLERSPAIVEKLHGKAVCFDVTTELRSGYWLLVTAALIECIAGNWVLAKCSAAFCNTSGTSSQNSQSSVAGLHGNSAERENA